MSELSNFFEFLYSHFVFRDITAKVLPGLLALFPVINLLDVDYERYLTGDSPIPILFIAVLLYGLGFAAGILLQFIGMKSRLTITHVWQDESPQASMKESVAQAIKFMESSEPASPIARKRERMIILKEMMGNYGISLLIVVIARLVSMAGSADSVAGILVTVLLAVVSALLIWHNRVLAHEQLHWEKHYLE